MNTILTNTVITNWAVAMAAFVLALAAIYLVWNLRRQSQYRKRIKEVTAILDDVRFYLEPHSKTMVIMAGEDGQKFVLNYLNVQADPIFRDFGNYTRVPYSRSAAAEAGMPVRKD